MTQTYFDPKRESDPHALPDCEIFHSTGEHSRECGKDGRDICSEECYSEECYPAGWYWRACFPGCLPDGDPMGPFSTEAEALADAREGME